MLSKKILIVTTTAGILLALSLSAESKQEASLKTQNTPISAKESQDETLYLETYGWLLGRQGGLVEYGITPEELKSVIKGFKAAGGIRTADEAVRYFDIAKRVRGDSHPDPATFRIGASSLLDSLVEAIAGGDASATQGSGY
ncbi:MAG: hypothetical protein Tsb0018_11230 [Opitutales bacterium]